MKKPTILPTLLGCVKTIAQLKAAPIMVVDPMPLPTDPNKLGAATVPPPDRLSAIGQAEGIRGLLALQDHSADALGYAAQAMQQAGAGALGGMDATHMEEINRIRQMQQHQHEEYLMDRVIEKVVHRVETRITLEAELHHGIRQTIYNTFKDKGLTCWALQHDAIMFDRHEETPTFSTVLRVAVLGPDGGTTGGHAVTHMLELGACIDKHAVIKEMADELIPHLLMTNDAYEGYTHVQSNGSGCGPVHDGCR